MSVEQLGSARSSLPPARRWLRRVVPAAFLATVIGAGILTVDHPRGGSAHRGVSHTSRPFSHTYPPDPVVPERPKVSGPSPSAPLADTIDGSVAMRSLAALAARLPAGVLRHERGSWVLTRPVAVAGHARLMVRGPASLLIEPGAFLQAKDG